MQRYMRTRPSRSLGAGFTIVELAVVIIVLTILASVTVTSVIGFQSRARDSQRSSDMSALSSALEYYYRVNAVATGGTYPDTTTDSADFSDIVEDDDIITAPEETTLSIVVASNANTQNPTEDEYIYQPFASNGSLCTTAPCVRYKLYYRAEDTDTIVTIDSMRQQ